MTCPSTWNSAQRRSMWRAIASSSWRSGGACGGGEPSSSSGGSLACASGMSTGSEAWVLRWTARFAARRPAGAAAASVASARSSSAGSSGSDSSGGRRTGSSSASAEGSAAACAATGPRSSGSGSTAGWGVRGPRTAARPQAGERAPHPGEAAPERSGDAPRAAPQCGAGPLGNGPPHDPARVLGRIGQRRAGRQREAHEQHRPGHDGRADVARDRGQPLGEQAADQAAGHHRGAAQPDPAGDQAHQDRRREPDQSQPEHRRPAQGLGTPPQLPERPGDQDQRQEPGRQAEGLVERRGDLGPGRADPVPRYAAAARGEERGVGGCEGGQGQGAEHGGPRQQDPHRFPAPRGVEQIAQHRTRW